MAPLAPAIQAVFEKSRGEFARRVATLDEAVAALLVDDLDEELRLRAERDAHMLAGSLGMFGLARGTELAREVEQALARPEGPTAVEAAGLAERVMALGAELDRPPARSERRGDRPASTSPALLLVSPDLELTERLSVEAAGRNMRPRSAATAAAAHRLAAAERPDAAVLDVSFAGDEGDRLELLEELAGRRPPVPVLVLTGSDALEDRVEVARRGGRGFMSRSRPASQVVEAVREQIERHDPSEVKVLAVDDDSVVSAALVALLGPSGVAVSTLNEPLRFWKALEEVEPHLLILDLDMPSLNGIDLCRAVRADVRFGQLPVVFLTANTDAACVQRIFEVGADDYVSKPIVGPELVTRVLNRLDRVRLHRDLAEKDSLTGVASRRKATEALQDFTAMCDRFEQPVSLALLDLDHFKRLNDQLGHAVGDEALRRVGQVLMGAFRGEDLVGRWGGEEFVVGMYGLGRDDGIRRVAEVLDSVRQEVFTGREGRTSRLSFSAGVAEYPRDGCDLHELFRAADEALYRAKAAGRDRVLPAGSPTRVASQGR